MNYLSNIEKHESTCLKGAIFTLKDIEPSKMIIALCEMFCKNAGETMSDNLKKSIRNNDFNHNILGEIIAILENELDFTDDSIEDDFTSYSDFIDILHEEEDLLVDMTAECWKWSYDEANLLMGTQEIIVYSCCDLEGIFVYDYDLNMVETIDDRMEIHYIFMVNSSLADYNTNNIKDKILCYIQEIAKILLKDDIDWDKRLGTFTGKIVEY